MIRIASLHLHPIKSCRGLAVDEATLDERGLVGDRRWMVVDEAGVFVTQREEPALNRVHVAAADGGWRVTAGGEVTIRSADATSPTEVSVWGDPVTARAHEEGSALLSDHLGRAVRLVCFGPEAERHAGRSAPSAKVAFADAYPLLLVSQASLDSLNERLDAPVPMRRFRPNVVVEGPEAHAEDEWDRFRLGTIPARWSSAAIAARSSRSTTTPSATRSRWPPSPATGARARRSSSGSTSRTRAPAPSRSAIRSPSTEGAHS